MGGQKRVGGGQKRPPIKSGSRMHSLSRGRAKTYRVSRGRAEFTKCIESAEGPIKPQYMASLTESYNSLIYCEFLEFVVH